MNKGSYGIMEDGCRLCSALIGGFVVEGCPIKVRMSHVAALASLSGLLFGRERIIAAQVALKNGSFRIVGGECELCNAFIRSVVV